MDCLQALFPAQQPDLLREEARVPLIALDQVFLDH